MKKLSKIYNLTKREAEVFNLIIMGLTNPKISEKLDISISTTKAHVKNIMRKLNVSNRIEIIFFTFKNYPELFE